jgi:hypothetical protein
MNGMNGNGLDLDGNIINLDAEVVLTTFNFEALNIDLGEERTYGDGPSCGDQDGRGG